MGLKLITAATAEPIDVSEVKAHCRIDFDTDDELIFYYIQTARDLVEAITRRKIMSQTWELYRDGFPDDDRCFELPFPPVSAVNSVKYIDSNGNLTTMTVSTDYVADIISEPANIVIANNAGAWPITKYATPNTVIVNFTSGYATVGDIPPAIKQAIRLLAAHNYENREASSEKNLNLVPNGVECLLSQYRVWGEDDDS